MNTIVIVIIGIILLIIAIKSRKADNVIIAFGLIDIFLRILDYIGTHTIKEVNDLINKLLPDSIPAIISNNTSGIISDILMWIYILLMILFVYYVSRLLLKRL